MKTIPIPYYTGTLDLHVAEENLQAVVTAKMHEYKAEKGESELVLDALEHPIGSPRLRELAAGKNKVVLVTSDHTRAVPSKITLPLLLAEIRKGNPEADITILIATGLHRATTPEEQRRMFGDAIVDHEKIAVNDAFDPSQFVHICTLPSGADFEVNRLAAECDLLLSEGFIEPHFFAGFSGGRKSVLPGVAARETVYANHCSVFLSHPCARSGILDGNPIHTDMLWAARKAGLAFLCNVALNGGHEVLAAFAGDCDQAHRAGCRYVVGLCRAVAPPSDIVITTNGGYPLDQNIYQAVKGMSTAEAVCREGGVIIMAAACEDGCGGESFRRTFQDEPDAAAILRRIEAVPAHRAEADQWQSQVFARVLTRCRVILVSRAEPALVRSLHMLPAATVEEAVALADSLLGFPGSITVIPDGVATIAAPAAG